MAVERLRTCGIWINLQNGFCHWFKWSRDWATKQQRWLSKVDDSEVGLSHAFSRS